MDKKLLTIDEVSLSFGGLDALSEVSFDVADSEIVGLIGPNGAGKSTLFNIISGIYLPSAGEISFKGIKICRLAPYKIVKLGIARTFQNIRLFSNMTALENIMVARHVRTKAGLVGSLFCTKDFSMEEAQIQGYAREILDTVNLLKFGNELAKNLSYGNQRRLEIARALATDPSLLLLDEPTAGMNLKESKDLMDLILVIRQRNIAIVIIEHQMDVVMNISDKVVVLDYGKKISQGTPLEVQNDALVQEAYLGKWRVSQHCLHFLRALAVS